jgi:uncharacterized protein YpmS
MIWRHGEIFEYFSFLPLNLLVLVYFFYQIARLKEFQMFNDKSSAINHVTGVSRELSEMISRYHHPYQTLAVGKSEYKGIIEKSLVSLKVPCWLMIVENLNIYFAATCFSQVYLAASMKLCWR